MQKHDRIIALAHTVYLRLKHNHPDWILPVIKLALPTITPQGTTIWTKGGMPNPPMAKITDDHVKRLLEDMQQRTAVVHLRAKAATAEQGKKHEQPDHPKKQAKPSPASWTEQAAR